MKIYNTLTRGKQEFRKDKEDEVTFYQCGPTVYSRQHIGNMFSAVKGDLVRRSLMYLGYNVKYVMNITDVGHLVSDGDSGEDKIEKGMKKENLSVQEITGKYTELYHKDLRKLNVLKPGVETVATKYVEQMGDMVQALIKNGYAYATKLAIYFDVSKFPTYTDLSGQKLEENISGAGHGSTGDPEKKSSEDFAIWFFKTGGHENAIQTWSRRFFGIDQEIEEGFPGWHIECSAMSKDTLGNTLDLHMGGREHIPVHHTNEIAQSEAANGEKFVNIWMHHEMLLIDDGKMSKSLGNVYSIDDLEEKGYDALDYRYFLLQAHYRSKQNFTWEALEASKVARRKLVSLLEDRNTKLEMRNSKQITNKKLETKNTWVKRFNKSLKDDFNVSGALAVVWEMMKSDSDAEEIIANIKKFDKVLGLKLMGTRKKKKKKELSKEVKSILDERQNAREEKDWKLSDTLRDKLKGDFGIVVEDTSDGQKIT